MTPHEHQILLYRKLLNQNVEKFLKVILVKNMKNVHDK